jgi:hypothetical protein
MTLRYLSEAEKHLEPFYDRHPAVLLDEHPGGDFVAMQVMANLAVLAERAAVWSRKSGKIIWRPQNANAICWSSKGDEVLYVWESYQKSAEHPPIIVTPLQSEYTYLFERCSWPDLKFIARCTIKFPMGWPMDIVPSPLGKLACVVWADQGEAGVELVSFLANDTCQLAGQGYYGNWSNLLAGPVFSPDGHFLAFTYGKGVWWSPDGALDTASLGGMQTVGWVVVGDIERKCYREVKVQTNVPEGWLPPDPEDMNYEMLSCPSFINEDCFKVTLPTGEERFFSASRARQVDG